MNLSFDLSRKKIMGIAIALLSVLLFCTYKVNTNPSGIALSGVIFAWAALAVLALATKIDVVIEVSRDELEPKTDYASQASPPVEPYPQRPHRYDIEHALVHSMAPGLQSRMDGSRVGEFIRAAADAILSGGLPAAKTAPTVLPVIDPGPDSLEREIQAKASNGPRVTPADIEAEIESEHYFNAFDGIAGAAYNEASPDGVLRQFTFEAPGALGQLTFCVLVLRNGTKVVGVNYGAIDPAQHSAERGRQEARAQAVDKVYELLGFRLRDELARPRLTEADSLADLAGTPRPDNPGTRP